MIRAEKVRTARKRYLAMAPFLNEQAVGALSRLKRKRWGAAVSV
jgi:hypothetical protein